MDKSHPRFIEKLENVERQGFSYKETSIPTAEGEFLASQIREHKYTTTLEIGCALGMSSVYICDALSSFEQVSHTIIDPYQTTQWKSIGVKNLERFGFDFFKLIEEPSEFVLPRLLQEQKTFDFAFIDGWHTFDHTLVDFFYLNRLIRVGGMIVFDDVKYPAVTRVLRYVAKYPHYALVSDENAQKPRGKQVKLYQFLIAGTHHFRKFFPATLRHILFTDAVLSDHPINNILLRQPRWMAVYKTSEDCREFNWYQDF